MPNKSEMARLVARGLVHETFAHETLGHFDITRLRMILRDAYGPGKEGPVRYCKFSELGMVDGITADAFSYLIGAREVDKVHASNLTERQLKDPLYFLLCPPGTNGEGESHLLVDGIHRLWERKKRGKEGFKFYLFPLELAPRIDDNVYREIKWGEKDLVPGVGLVTRKER